MSTCATCPSRTPARYPPRDRPMTDRDDEKTPREPDEAGETPESEDPPAPATWAGRQRSSSEDAGEHAQLSDEGQDEEPQAEDAEDQPEAEEAQDEPED